MFQIAAIHGSYKLEGATAPFVWRLDFSTVPVEGKPPATSFIQLYKPASSLPATVKIFFKVNSKDGSSIDSSIPVSRDLQWVDTARPVHSNVMTDGCSLMSFDVGLSSPLSISTLLYLSGRSRRSRRHPGQRPGLSPRAKCGASAIGL